jgi:hypothetical protein
LSRQAIGEGFHPHTATSTISGGNFPAASTSNPSTVELLDPVEVPMQGLRQRGAPHGLITAAAFAVALVLALPACSSSDGGALRTEGRAITTSSTASDATTIPVRDTATTADTAPPPAAGQTSGSGSVTAGTARTGGGTAPTTSTTAAPSPAPALTREDDGRTYTAHVGEVINVHLTADSGTRWSAPTSDSAAVLAGSGTTAPDGAGNGSFTARSPGTARITATQDPQCRSASPPCGMPSRMYSVTISVK